jgi:hypothetical protein
MSTAELKDRLERELAEDRLFLRKLKPSLVAARARGRRSEPAAQSAPQLAARAPASKTGGGPSPLLVIGAALAAGIALAKWVDWRGHAHPRG